MCCKEQRADQVREKLLGQCQAEMVEPPTGTRVGRIIGSALQRADDTLTARISDRILIAGRRYLHHVLSEYVDHYNTHRPHRALRQQPPDGRAHVAPPDGKIRVRRRARLGGLIHEYSQAA